MRRRPAHRRQTRPAVGQGVVPPDATQSRAQVERLGLERRLSQTLAQLLELPDAFADEEILRAQSEVCALLGLDRSTLWQAEGAAEGPFALTHRHGADGPPLGQRADAQALFPWTLEQIRRGDVVAVSRVDDLPEAAARDVETWRQCATQSALVLPLATGHGQTFGALSLEAVGQAIDWPPDAVQRLQRVARTFALALARQRSERGRVAAEARYQRLQSSMTEAYVSVTMDGQLADFNDAYQEMLGYSREELLGLTYQELTPAKWHRLEADVVEQQLLVRGSAPPYTKEYRRKDGSVFPVELRTFVIKDPDGRPAGMWAIVRDVSERVRAEHLLRESRATLAAVIDSTDDIVFCVDASAHVLLAFNAALSEHFRRSHGIRVAPGMGIEDLFSSEDYRRRWRGFFERALREGRFTTSYHTAAAGRHLRLSFHVLERDGEVFGISVFGKDMTVQDETQENLRRSEERLRLAMQAASIGIFDADLVTGEGYFSPEMGPILGLPPDAVPPKVGIPEFVHPEDAPRVEAARQRMLDPAGDGTSLDEHRIVRPDGSVRWVQFRARARFEGNGAARRAVRISGTILDITERKEVEETLRQRNAYIETVLERAPIGFAVHTIDDGVGRFVSARYEEIYGCARGTILSHQTFFDAVWPRHPELRDEIRARVVADMTSGDASRMRWDNVPVPLASGETRFISAMNIPILDQNLMVSTVQDVTDQVRAAERLRESELRFRQVAESVADFIWEVDAQGLYTYTSPSVERILGYTPDELVGKRHFYELFAPDVREKLTAAALEAFAARRPFRGFVNANLSKAGAVVYLETSGVPLLDAAGNLRGYRGADSDISDRKRAEELLRRSYVQIEAQKGRLQAERDYLERTGALGHTFGIVGESRAIRETLAQVEQVAPTGASVLIMGETGTGKERLAQAVHDLSPRRNRLMVTVNCAALPPTLIESELFGHEKGAYTSAVTAQAGRFELADGSTLFLDEVAELPPELQAKLLRVLEEGQFERLGSSRTRKVDVRLVAATNRDLLTEVREGRFRQDLYYRLNVFPIRVAPLRERREDIPLLVRRFADDFGRAMGKTIEAIPQGTMDALQQLPWPGNVRELRNLIERAVILSTGPVLTVSLPVDGGAAAEDGPLTLEEVERRHLIEILTRTGWHISGDSGAAALLGVKRTTLQSKLKKLGIARDSS
jgi:formate hydrogenlyase transcriptional activator